MDYGDVRIGFAMSDPTGVISMPLCTIELKHGLNAENEVKHICDVNNAEKLIVGLPLNMNGSIGPMAVKVEAFIERLKLILKIPVEKWDERLSTSFVERMLVKESDMSRKKRKGVRDKLAAQVILQGYLDKCNMSNNTPGDEQV
jgi:putative Holliday junction resolvase